MEGSGGAARKRAGRGAPDGSEVPPGGPAADRSGEGAGGGDDAGERDAGFDPEAVQQVEEVLGRDVSGRARRVGAAARALPPRRRRSRCRTPGPRRRWRAPSRACRGSGARGRPATRPSRRASRSRRRRPPASRRRSCRRARSRRPEGRAACARPLEPPPARWAPRTGSRTPSTRIRAPGSSPPARARPRAESLDRLVDARVDVVPVERLRRRREDGDLAHSRLHRALEAPHVRHERRITRAARPVDPPVDLLGVGELGDRLRGDEGADLDRLQPGVRQEVDEFDARFDGEGLRLVLQAVAGADLVDRDARRKVRPPDRVLLPGFHGGGGYQESCQSSVFSRKLFLRCVAAGLKTDN